MKWRRFYDCLWVHFRGHALEDAVGWGGELFFFLEEQHFVAEFLDDLRTDLFHPNQCVYEDEAGNDVIGLGEAELEVAIDDFAFAAEESIRHAVHRAAMHGDELLETEKVLREVGASRHTVEAGRRFSFQAGLADEECEKLVGEKTQRRFGLSSQKLGVERAEYFGVDGANEAYFGVPWFGNSLLLLLAGQPGAVNSAPRPQWVAEWKAKRAERAEKKEVRAAQAEAAPVDPNAQAKRKEKRETNILRGLDQLDGWLADLVRQGLAATATAGYKFWEEPARRLIDAQAAGVARRVKELGAVSHGRPDFEERATVSLGRLHLVSSAYRRRNELSSDWQTKTVLAGKLPTWAGTFERGFGQLDHHLIGIFA